MGPPAGMMAVEILDPWEQLMSPVWGWGYWEQWGQALVVWDKLVLLGLWGGRRGVPAEGAEVPLSPSPRWVVRAGDSLDGGRGRGLPGAPGFRWVRIWHWLSGSLPGPLPPPPW